MSSTIFFFLFIPILSFILLAINIAFASHNPYMEKNNAFECGFTSFVGQNRIQFSISFFIFALLFLLFDLEILLVYPYLVSAYLNELYGLLILMAFLGVLTIGFVFELGKKALTIDSRQTTWSSNSSTRKPLSKISDIYSNTGSVINSRLFNESCFIEDYKPADLNLHGSHVRSFNLNVSSPLRAKREYSLYGDEYHDRIVTFDLNASNHNGGVTNDIDKRSHITEINTKVFSRNLHSTKKKLCLSSSPLLPTISFTMPYNQKRAFSTTNTLNGLGIMAQVNKVNTTTDGYMSYVLGGSSRDHFFNFEDLVKKDYSNFCIRKGYSGVRRSRRNIPEHVPASKLNKFNCDELRSYRTIVYRKNYYENKVDAIMGIESERSEKLNVLLPNLLVDDKLPSIRHNREPATRPMIQVGLLDYVRDTLEKNVTPKPVGWEAHRSFLTDDHFDKPGLRPPYTHEYTQSVGFNISSDEKGAKIIYPVNTEDSLIMEKPELINKDLAGNVIGKPLEPVELFNTNGSRAFEEAARLKNILTKNYCSSSVKHPSSVNLESAPAPAPATAPAPADPSPEIAETISSMCLLSISLSEVSPCLRFLFTLVAMLKTNSHYLLLYMLRYNSKSAFINSLSELVKTISVTIVFVIKNRNLISNCSYRYNSCDHCSCSNRELNNKLNNKKYVLVKNLLLQTLCNIKLLFSIAFVHIYIYIIISYALYKAFFNATIGFISYKDSL